MKLLIVEDEPKTGSYLKKGFTESGYVVDLAYDGVDGLYQATTNHYDLIILDIMLPKLNGWQVLQTMRSSQLDTPIIMLSAKDQVEDRVKGLELGANDYVVKPFAFVELLARVKNALRHQNGQVKNDATLVVADLSLDLLKRTGHRGGDAIVLTAKEFSLLELFLQRRGEVLSRSLISSLIWDMNFDSDTNVIDVAVKRLRAKIDKPYEVKLIHTVRGMGYKLDDSLE
ncbi:DNA-binding transcriptional activator CusR [Vibrio crassostreae]|jgi:two-component system copper resistance phosphate regulon response regulator CusR|uniref:DNA-binding response regulator in two-component regulatory system with CusS n=2 Tax=Vibrio TaxID=662 RepID=A0A4R3P855_9VIBR|nr:MULTISPECIES: heavy metal response regulator transcription factor [Vibrio]APB62023.1 DNA-binding response regulator in two-component regulatory system with CusS [Vibrio crassostreae]MDH5922976.1 heavy metal response regulator transcription factor [Vibrio splendidus]MDH5938511.1 heavy metal response regulator transcription factor [Vibrio splendidus]MDH5951818.1 heavy metal response regulator transcription factor [Vibrio crassostreae]NOH77837.1 response regulator [Vibrio crassostreae]